MNEFSISSNHNIFPSNINNNNGIETIHLLSPRKTQHPQQQQPQPQQPQQQQQQPQQQQQQQQMTSINVHIKEEHSSTLGTPSTSSNDPSYQPATPPLTPKRDDHDKKHQQDMILHNQQQHNPLLQSPIKQGTNLLL